jgi:hypothetical protein
MSRLQSLDRSKWACLKDFFGLDICNGFLPFDSLCFQQFDEVADGGLARFQPAPAPVACPFPASSSLDETRSQINDQYNCI